MKRLVVGCLVAVAAAVAADRAEAQGTLPLSLGVRIDAGLPTGDAGDVLDTGFGWGVEAALDLTPSFAIYGGYSRFEFDIEGVGGDVSADGFEVGGRVLLGTGAAVWTPFAQFGVLFHEDETGFEVGLGADYPVGNSLSLTPMVRYRSIDNLDYVTIGVGLSFRL